MLKKKNPSRNIIIVSFSTALSRIFGLIRDMMFSRVIGISFVADAFFIALRLPNLFRRITAEGAFSAAFIPIFSKKFLENNLRAKKKLIGKIAHSVKKFHTFLI